MAVCGTITNDGSGNLTYTGAAGINNTLKIAVSGANTTFNDTSGTITNSFGSGSGGGTATVTIATASIVTITVDLADGTNILNLWSTNITVAFNPSAGTNTLNVNGNAPTNTATTFAIAANVSVAPTGGTLNVTVSDQGGSSGDSVGVTATTVTGLLGSAGANTLTYSGVATLRLSASTSASVVNTFTVTAPGCTTLRLDNCGGGGTNPITLGGNCAAAMSISGSAARNMSLTSNGHTIAALSVIGVQYLSLIDALSVTGALTTAGNSTSTFDANGQTVTVGGLATHSSGTYLASTATQTFNGGLTKSSTSTFTGSSGDVHCNGTFTLSGGTFTEPSGAFTISGNVAVSGTPTFTAGTNTVTLNGIAQTITPGSTSFYNLVANTTNDVITFTDGSTTTITNAITLQNVTLQGSGVAGYTIAMPATQTIDHVIVSHCTATGNIAAAGPTSTDALNNVNWTFGSSPVAPAVNKNVGGGLINSTAVMKSKYNKLMG